MLANEIQQARGGDARDSKTLEPKWIDPQYYDRMEVNMAPPSGWICPSPSHPEWPKHIKHVLYETASDDAPVCVTDTAGNVGSE